MTFYRNHYAVEGGISGGYEWFTSEREARRVAHEFDRIHKDNEQETYAQAIARPIDIEPTKAGILEALERYASHPDNG